MRRCLDFCLEAACGNESPRQKVEERMKLNDAARNLIGKGADATLVTLNPDGSPQVSLVWVALQSTPDGDELAGPPRRQNVAVEEPVDLPRGAQAVTLEMPRSPIGDYVAEGVSFRRRLDRGLAGPVGLAWTPRLGRHSVDGRHRVLCVRIGVGNLGSLTRRPLYLFDWRQPRNG